MMTHLRLLLVTAILTIVIWVCADQASQGTASVWATIRVVSSNPEAAAVIVEETGSYDTSESATARVRLEFAGSKAAIRRLTGQETRGAAEYRVTIPDRWLDGHFDLDVTEAMNRTKEVRDRGLHVTVSEPPSVRVFVDPRTTVSFTVEPDPGWGESMLAGPVTVEPRTVRGQIRASHLAKLGTAAPTVILPVQDALREAVSLTDTMIRGLPLPKTVRDFPVEFDPPRVTVTAALAQRTIVKRLSPVPVSVLLPPELVGDCRVRWADGDAPAPTVAVDVRVLPDRAKGLNPGDVRAFVAINVGDVASAETTPDDRWITRAVQFAFPADYEDVRLEGPAPTVRFRVDGVPSSATSTRSAATLPAN